MRDTFRLALKLLRRDSRVRSSLPVKTIPVTLGLFLLLLCSADAKDLLPLPERYETTQLVNVTGLALPSQANAPLGIAFHAYSRSLILDMLPADIFVPNARTVSMRSEGEVEVPTVNYSFEGKVYGNPDSAVHLTLIGDSLKGIIAIGPEVFIVEPRSAYSTPARPGEVLIQRAGENPLPEVDCDVHDDVLAEERLASQSTMSLGPFLNPPLLQILNPSRLAYRLDIGLLGDSS